MNAANWNERVGLHVNHGYDEKTGEAYFYDINSFRQGKCSLQSVELEEIVRPSSSASGPRSALDGSRLLHLQCHFGYAPDTWLLMLQLILSLIFSPSLLILTLYHGLPVAGPSRCDRDRRGLCGEGDRTGRGAAR